MHTERPGVLLCIISSVRITGGVGGLNPLPHLADPPSSGQNSTSGGRVSTPHLSFAAPSDPVVPYKHKNPLVHLHLSGGYGIFDCISLCMPSKTTRTLDQPEYPPSTVNVLIY